MVSGVECAGLVLAITPLFIEAAKVYSDGIESILNVTVKSRWDEKLEEFYEEFYYQMVELNYNMSKICASAKMTNISNLSDSSKLLAQWSKDINIENSLRNYFNSEDSFNWFMRISKRILIILEKLVQEKSNRLSSKYEVNSRVTHRLIYTNTNIY